MESIGKLFVTTILVIISILVNGLLIYKGFQWFIAPVWGDIALITYAQANGLSIFYSMVFARLKVKKEDNKDFTEMTATAIIGWVYAFILLFIGWIGHMVIY